MAQFRRVTSLPVPAGEAFAWHARPGAFERLAPPFQDIRIVARTGGLEPGGQLSFEVRKGPVAFRWVAGHGEYEAGRRFTDFQQEGPFAAWHHTHTFREDGAGGCELEDLIQYRLPLGALGRLLAGRAIAADLARTFDFRARRLAEDLARLREAPAGALRIAVTGASGLVGSALVPFLTTGGHHVDPLVRRAPRPRSAEIPWDPGDPEMDLVALEGADAVVHLAGENLAARRWTPDFKEAVRWSRVAGTANLCAALARLRRPPKALVCASAIGYYGARGEEDLTEESGPGSGFLPETCAAWEAACAPARDAGVRVVNLRIGVVLSGRGGALARMATPFRLGLGGPVGGGRQWVSWIALEDLVYLLHRALWDGRLSGPVNAVSPRPARQADLAATLGRVLGRPALVPLPAAAVRLLLGEMGQALLLDGARVLPSRLETLGHRFLYGDLDAALRAELGRPMTAPR